MGLFDGILSQLGEHADVGNLAGKLGIDPALAEKAIAALGKAHGEPGDTIASAAEKTGLDSGMLGQIVDQIGGEGALGRYADMLKGNPIGEQILGAIDRDGDGNPLNDLAGLAGNLFGKK